MAEKRDHPLADQMTSPIGIPSEGADGGGSRKLPTVEDETPEPDVGEAYGGTGEVPEEPVEPDALKERILGALRTVYDPEIPVNIQDLGLIYGLEVDSEGRADIEMTLTAPGCPVAGYLVQEVARKAGEVEGVSTSRVRLTWEPPWTPDRMTEEAKLELGLL